MLAVKITMYAMLFLVPVLMFIIGRRVRKNPPKEINNLVGYRTRRSMASQEAWDYANERLGELMIKSSLLTLIVGFAGVVVMEFKHPDPEQVIFTILICIFMAIQVVIIILPMKTIEKELKDEVYKNKQ